MKAVILKKFGGVENFELATVDAPRISPGGVKIRVKAVAFNPIDYQMRQGGTESKLLKSAILGRELSGIVTEIGSAVEHLRVGDEVFSYVSSLGSNGAYAEEIVVPAPLVARKPANLDFYQAAAIPLVGLTAAQAVQRSPTEPSAKIFVAGGAGGVGSMIIRLLKLKGARSVFSSAGNEESRNQLKALGLSDGEIHDYRDALIDENLLSAADGKFDVCFDTVGGIMSEISAKVLKIEGVYTDITFLSTEAARETLFNKAATIVNIANYAYTLEGVGEKLNFYRENLDFLSAKIESSKLAATPIDIVGDLSVETVARAHEVLEKNLTRGKKLVMKVS